MNHFNSMLPEDTKKCKCIEKQPSVIEHFGPEDQDAKPIPYSNKALEAAALKWLIKTNQVNTRLVFDSKSCMIYMNNATAYPDVQECCVQEDARHNILCQLGYMASLAQAVKVSHYQDVQAAVALTARPPQCLFVFSSLLFFFLFTDILARAPL